VLKNRAIHAAREGMPLPVGSDLRSSWGCDAHWPPHTSQPQWWMLRVGVRLHSRKSAG